MYGSTAAQRQILRRSELFAQLTDSELDSILAHTSVSRFPEGEQIFAKGDPGSSMMAVLKGRVMISSPSRDGRQVVLTVMHEGDFFGEIALLDGKGRTATAVAREPCELLFLGRADFLPFLRERHDAAVRIIAFLCERLRRTTGLVEDSAFLSVSSRLAKQLAMLSAAALSSDLDIRMSQEELAQTLGVSREIVSRQLAAWREAGVIELGRRRIRVRDAAALDRIVAGG